MYSVPHIESNLCHSTPHKDNCKETLNAINPIESPASHLCRFTDQGWRAGQTVTFFSYWHFQESVLTTLTVFHDEIKEIWLSKMDSSEYTMVRYVGTRDGVFLQMPGDRIPNGYDHTKRTWWVQTDLLDRAVYNISSKWTSLNMSMDWVAVQIWICLG